MYFLKQFKYLIQSSHFSAQKVFMSFLANGIIGLTTASMEAIVRKLKKKVYLFFMETEVFTMMINNQLLGLSMKQ